MLSPLDLDSLDADAELLLVDGNPLDDVTLLVDPEKNFVVIMKDGTVFKNKLD